ncbi:MAG: hypothetical protein II332_03515 [Kiritimatiellae bacterium]|nr:hypothetical protein [Kiritimatiellia bacterium]
MQENNQKDLGKATPSKESNHPKYFSDDIRERQRRQRNMAPLWPLLSFLLHLTLFALLVIFTPIKEILIKEKEPPKSTRLSEMTEKELEKIDDNIEMARENEIAQYLMELQTILHNMEFMKNELLKSFDEFAKQEAEQVKPEMEQLFDKVIEKQNRSIELQAKVEAVVEEVAELEKNNEVAQIKDSVAKKISESENALKEIEESQAVAQNLLDVIVAKAQITEMEKTAEATEVARKAQLEINELQAETRQTLFELRDGNAWQIEIEKHIENEIKYREENLKQELTKKEEDVKQKKEELEKSIQELAKAEQIYEEIKDKPEATQQEKKKAQHEVNSKRNQRDRVQKDLNRRESSKANTEKRIEDSKKKQADHEKNLEKAKKEKEARTEKLDKLDDELSKSQQELVERVKEIAELAKSETPKPEPRADETMTSPELANVNLSIIPLAEAYEKAKELEQQIAERNRDIKATELAINQKMSLEMAEDITDVAKTERPEFNKEILNSTPKTENQFVEKREEMTKVVRETEDILEKAMVVMNEAQAMMQPQEHGAAIQSDEDRLARMRELAELENQIAEQGAEDLQEKAKDLAELMRAAEMLAAQENIPEEESHDMEEDEGSNNKTSIPAGATGMAGIAKLEPTMPGLEPGNMFGSAGVPAVWGFVNSWYVIGPFDNPNRVNLTRKFAPESVVDLDASYIGKGGKTVKWTYEQATATAQNNPYMHKHANRSMVRPEYSGEYEIWYAYTEIFMEEECDLWLGIGSDDRSDIWINDFKIWSSSDNLKAWRIDEGFRRVHLRKGRNKILARVENGHWNFGWSICLTPDPSVVK